MDLRLHHIREGPWGAAGAAGARAPVCSSLKDLETESFRRTTNGSALTEMSLEPLS